MPIPFRGWDVPLRKRRSFSGMMPSNADQMTGSRTTSNVLMTNGTGFTTKSCHVKRDLQGQGEWGTIILEFGPAKHTKREQPKRLTGVPLASP